MSAVWRMVTAPDAAEAAVAWAGAVVVAPAGLAAAGEVGCVAGAVVGAAALGGADV